MIPNKILTHIECVEMNWANFIGGGFLLGCASLPQPTALSGLWNQNHADEAYDPVFLQTLKR